MEREGSKRAAESGKATTLAQPLLRQRSWASYSLAVMFDSCNESEKTPENSLYNVVSGCTATIILRFGRGHLAPPRYDR